jgi:predicted Zn-dependent protease
VFEVDLNNGVFREIDLSKPVYCAACGKEIHGNTHDVDISQSVIDVHTSGLAFCKSCKRAFTK